MTLYFSKPNQYLKSSFTKNPSLFLLPGICTSVRKVRFPRMDFTVSTTNRRLRRKEREKEKVIVIMGATGAGKSQLSIDLATRFFTAAEIINSDKMQVYRGLDITTNKIPFHERENVPHHLLGEINSSHDEDFTPSDYRLVGASVISDIVSRRKIPFIVGGSNSFIHSLLVDKYDPNSNPFNGSNSISSNLRYNCCFIWVDISTGVLAEYLKKRVDDMLDSGMFDELIEFYDPKKHDVKSGIRNAIGVPEFNRYFKKYPPLKFDAGEVETNPNNDVAKIECYAQAVKAIKDNTCQLAKRQIWKILRLKNSGWDLNRVDATEAFNDVMMSDTGKKGSANWERNVVEPSVKIVKRFLDG